MKLFYVGAGPSPRLLVRSGDRPNHLENVGAPCCENGHTSSKGMPRHAHGRWALMRVCGVVRCVVELLVVCKVVSTDGMFGVKEKETSLNISGLARKPRKRRIKVKIRPWCVSFSGYILISPEREMECTQLFCALG